MAPSLRSPASVTPAGASGQPQPGRRQGFGGPVSLCRSGWPRAACVCMPVRAPGRVRAHQSSPRACAHCLPQSLPGQEPCDRHDLLDTWGRGGAQTGRESPGLREPAQLRHHPPSRAPGVGRACHTHFSDGEMGSQRDVFLTSLLKYLSSSLTSRPVCASSGQWER